MTAETVPSLTGRIIEVGRSGSMSEVVIDVGRGELVKISGFSDTVAKALARGLYKHVKLEFEVYGDG